MKTVEVTAIFQIEVEDDDYRAQSNEDGLYELSEEA